MRQYYILAFVLLASFSSLSLAQSGSRDCERPLAGEQISDFGLRTESEFEIEVKLSDTDLIDSLKVLLSQDFPDKFIWRIISE